MESTFKTELQSSLNSHENQMLKQMWFWVLSPLILVQQLVLYYPFPPRRFFNSDPATFMYGGNLLTRGYAPYLYLWDIKPPAVYDTTALIAFIAPNDPYLQYYIGSLLTSLMAAVTILMAAALVYRVSQNNVAAIATGMTIFAYPWFVMLPTSGIWTKYFALAFGFVGIYLLLDERYILAAVTSSIAAGYWQFGAIFPIIILIGAWRYNGTLWKVVVGMFATTLIVTAPIIILGGLMPMIEQAVLTPLSMGDQSAGLFDRIRKFKGLVSYAWPLFYGGALCAFYYVTQNRNAWWMGLGLGWSLLQIGLLDFDSSPDPLMLIVFIAIGLGLFIGTLNRRQQLGLLFVISTMMAGQMYSNRGPYVSPPNEEPNMEKPQVVHFVEGKYPPSTCLIANGGYSFERRLSGDGLPQRCDSL